MNQVIQPARPSVSRRLAAAVFLLAALSGAGGNAPSGQPRHDISAPKSYPSTPSRAVLQSSARQSDPLIEFVRALEETDPAALADFAWIALDEMHAAYEKETIELSAPEHGLALSHPHARWVFATRAYAARLRELADTISADTPVRVRVDPPGILLVEVDGQLVEVSGPRIAEPNYMGRRIVERYCEIRPCDLNEAPFNAYSAQPTTVEAVWSFSQGRGPVCVTNIGLEFQFEDLRHLSRKRTACLQVAEQLVEFSSALSRAADTGVRIDWDTVDIVSTGAGRPEQISLNQAGDYLLLSVPSLGASRALRQLSMPWVRARVHGEPLSQSIPHADRLLAALLPLN